MSRNVYDGGAWDVGPPGAEEDYAAHRSHHRHRRDRDARYEYGRHESGRRDRPQRRSHSPSPDADRKRCPPRRRHSPSGTPSPPRLRSFSISSDSDRSTPSRSRRPPSPPLRTDALSRRDSSSPEHVRRHRAPSFTPPKSYKTRAASKSSSSSRSTSSSMSRSRSRSRSYSSRSRSRSPRDYKSRRNTRRSTSLRRTSKSRRSVSQRRNVSSRCSASPRRGTSSKRSASPRRSASPARSRSSSRDSDSSSSSRGRFSGYDRKRYFRALNEKLAKERELMDQKGEPEVEVKEEVPPPPALSTDDIYELEYKQLPPFDGINFEDLPPPSELAGGSGLSKRPAPPVCIRNDGTFLEMFKKLQEETQKSEASTAPAPTVRKPVPPFIGKRRGGRVLKTGVVQKIKVKEETSDTAPKDAWSLYMQEVKKYRETSCEEERKTRPLVK